MNTYETYFLSWLQDSKAMWQGMKCGHTVRASSWVAQAQLSVATVHPDWAQAENYTEKVTTASGQLVYL